MVIMHISTVEVGGEIVDLSINYKSGEEVTQIAALTKQINGSVITLLSLPNSLLKEG